MNIPHLTRPDGTDFYPLIRDALRQPNRVFPVTVPLNKAGGYSGEINVSIVTATEPEFEAEIELGDWTRFPARIRASATALRDSGCFGTFRITHRDAEVTIQIV